MASRASMRSNAGTVSSVMSGSGVACRVTGIIRLTEES